MPKGRIQLRLTEIALKNLRTRSDVLGMTRQDFIEAWLTDSLPACKPVASQPDTKLDSTERIDAMDPEKRARLEAKGWQFGSTEEFLGGTSELDAVGPTVESGRGKASVETIRPKPLPLERKQVVSIPKPGKSKGK